MEKIEVFVRGEGIKDTEIVKVPKGGSVTELLEALSKKGINLSQDENPSCLFLEESEEPLRPDQMLAEAGINDKSHVHVHRVRKIEITVTYNGSSETKDFPPSTTLYRIKEWAVSKKVFNLSEVDSAEHVLQISGSNIRPDEDSHIGSLVNYPAQTLSFDLVPKIRVEG